MSKKIAFTLLAEHGLDHYGLTQIWFESEGFYYYYRCRMGYCSLVKFANEADLDQLENRLGFADLEQELTDKEGFLGTYPHAHYIVIGKLLAEINK